MTPEQSAYAHEIASWATLGQTGYDQGEWIYLHRESDGWNEKTNESIGVPVEKIREGSCGTDACIAGRVAIDRAPVGTLVFDGETLKFPNGSEDHVSDFAARELGLTKEQADAVFYADAPEAAERLHYVADHPEATAYQIHKVAP